MIVLVLLMQPPYDVMYLCELVVYLVRSYVGIQFPGPSFNGGSKEVSVQVVLVGRNSASQGERPT